MIFKKKTLLAQVKVWNMISSHLQVAKIKELEYESLLQVINSFTYCFPTLINPSISLVSVSQSRLASNTVSLSSTLYPFPPPPIACLENLQTIVWRKLIVFYLKGIPWSMQQLGDDLKIVFYIIWGIHCQPYYHK